MASGRYVIRWHDRIMYRLYALCGVSVWHEVGGKLRSGDAPTMWPVWFYKLRYLLEGVVYAAVNAEAALNGREPWWRSRNKGGCDGKS